MQQRNFTVFTGLILLMFCFIASPAVAQQHFNLKAEAATSVSTDEINPLWLYSNQWGKYQQFGESEAVGNVNGYYEASPLPNLNLKAGLGLLGNTNGDAVLHEAYISGEFYFLDFTAGKYAMTPNTINDDLTSGMFLGSNNAQPIPRIWVGIFDYTKIPFTKGWVEVKGAASNGWLNDNETDNGHQEVMFHEKYLYFRLGNVSVQPYLGLYHSALYGGKGIPADFWATFKGSGSEKVGGGEATNAAGAHMGMWHGGVTFPVKDWKGHFYMQKPFGDGSGMYVNWGYNKDFITGLLFEREGNKWLTGISIEGIRTDWQSGPGTTDPITPSGVGIWPGDVTNVQDFVTQYFPDLSDQAANWSKDDLYDYMSQVWNQGYHFGGRDGYMNNGMYYSGWSWKGLSTGSPLFHPADMAQQYAPEWQMNNTNYFVNTRVRAIHFGAEGCLRPELTYRLKMTATRNFGSYEEHFINMNSWIADINDYFSFPKNEYYTMLQLGYKPAKYKHWTISASMGCDWGDIYNSTGGRIALAWALN